MINVKCIPVPQDETQLYLFSMSAQKLWRILKINERMEDKDEGYQRVLSPSRVAAIAKYVNGGHVIAPAIVVSLEGAEVSGDGFELRIPDRENAGWVIDGQHRLAGAAHADKDIALSVVAFVNLEVEAQIRQFVTINKEAKGVPTSLYYDLLSHIPDRKPSEVAKERAADIGKTLRRDEGSPFYARIVSTTSPKRGELSLTNFVRKVAPLVLESKGALQSFTLVEQTKIIDNYYMGFLNAFPKERLREPPRVFQTLGFGALMNAFPTVFSICIKHFAAFRVEDVTTALSKIRDYNLSQWDKGGTGSAAEIQAGKDFETELKAAFEIEGASGTIRL